MFPRRVEDDCRKHDRRLVSQPIVLLDTSPGMLAALRKIVESTVSVGFHLEFLLEIVYCTQHEIESREPVTEE